MGPVWVDMFYHVARRRQDAAQRRSSCRAGPAPASRCTTSCRRRPPAPRSRASSSTSRRAPEVRAEASSSSSTGIPASTRSTCRPKMDGRAGTSSSSTSRPHARELRTAVPAVRVLHRHPRGVQRVVMEVPCRRLAILGASRERGSTHARPIRSGRPDIRPCNDARGRARTTRPRGAARERAPGPASALAAPALAIVTVFFVAPLPRCPPSSPSGARDGGPTPSTSPRRSALLDRPPVLRGDRRRLDDRHRAVAVAIAGYLTLGEHPHAGDPALALPLAAVHPVHRHRPGDAHVPREERDAEPR